ncbi:Alpha/Beta hydrolase protein [Lactarius indigo]|nr:Alpha/Beta hydrolase protein [Lactarius indigo]
MEGLVSGLRRSAVNAVISSSDPGAALGLNGPFKIAVSDDALALLKRKLDDTRFPDEINAAEWAYGAPLADIKRLVSRWKDGYDWRTHERKLNALPMFTRTIGVDGFGELDIHYVHQKSVAKGAIPLLFVHGSVSADHPSFHVVRTKPSWLFNKLMISLGYTEYVTQGGDWGHILTLTTASLYGPKHVKASHTNLPICEPPTFRNPIVLLQCLIGSFTSGEREAAAASQDFFKSGMGYFAEQSYQAADSRIQLGRLARRPSRVDIREALLTWISIYWFSRAGPAASIRIYYEVGDAVVGFPKDDHSGWLVLLPQGARPVPQSQFKSIEGKDESCFPSARAQSSTTSACPTEVNAAEWGYGVPLADIKRLRFLCSQRTIAVDGFGELNVHYVHQKSTAKGAIPLLFVHGWPGSFLEVTEGTAAFDLSFRGSPIVPRRCTKPSRIRMVRRGAGEGLSWEALCLRGRLGLTLTTASLYGPKHVKASHTNMPMCEPPKFFKNPIVLLKCLITSSTSREREAAARSQDFFKNGMGYFAEQTTKPQTLGFSLADSPVGLLAWIYEKLVTWTDAYPWTDDEVLTWISIYWFSRAGPAASVRIYYELAHSGEVIGFPKTTVPIGLSFFPKELARVPKPLIRSKGRIVFESEHEAGGHFAAYEQPEALVDDLRKMFGKSGPAAGVVSGLREKTDSYFPTRGLCFPSRESDAKSISSRLRLGMEHPGKVFVCNETVTCFLASGRWIQVHEEPRAIVRLFDYKLALENG